MRRRDALADLVVKHLLKSSVAFVGWDVELDGALVECCRVCITQTDDLTPLDMLGPGKEGRVGGWVQYSMTCSRAGLHD